MVPKMLVGLEFEWVDGVASERLGAIILTYLEYLLTTYLPESLQVSMEKRCY